MKLTPMVIPQIKSWVDEGLSTHEIAQKVGCTVGTLRVRCSQLRISLRRARITRALIVGNASARQAALAHLPSIHRRASGRHGANAAEPNLDRERQLLVVVLEITLTPQDHPDLVATAGIEERGRGHAQALPSRRPGLAARQLGRGDCPICPEPQSDSGSSIGGVR